MKLKNLRAMFFVRSGNYFGCHHDDRGLKRSGGCQAVNIAKTTTSLVGTGNFLIVSGTKLRMRQTAEIMSHTLGCEFKLDRDFDTVDDSRYICRMTRVVEKEFALEICKYDDRGVEVLIFVGYTDILDSAVRAIDRFFKEAFPDGLELPSRRSPDYGGGSCCQIGEGEAWFVDIAQSTASIVGFNASETLFKPGGKV